MNGEGRLSVTLVVSIIFVVAAVGIAAYFAGRFGRSSRAATAERMELPEPAAPAPAVVESIAIPAEIPPTVTPPIPVVVEKTTRSSKVLVERSSSIVVSVPPAPTARPASAPFDPGQPIAARNRIVVEVRPTPTPTPTPTVPEIAPSPEPLPEETPEPEPEPDPEPTAKPRIPVALRPISEGESCRDLSNRDLSRRSSRPTRGGADRPIGC